MPTLAQHDIWWSELDRDAALTSLRIQILGWVPRKEVRYRRASPGDAICVLAKGSGVFLHAGDDAPSEVRAPGVFFISTGSQDDFGPANGSRWDEFYWKLTGPRVAEWKRIGWWPERSSFHPISTDTLAELWGLFRSGDDAMRRRDACALDVHKLELERWLCVHASRLRGPSSSLENVVAEWRREPWRQWSMPAVAKAAGVSYTRFRREFFERYGTSPYDYLIRLRMDLAGNLLSGTSDSVKSIAVRCGFKHVETFLRAFASVHGTTPRGWRARELEGAGPVG